MSVISLSSEDEDDCIVLDSEDEDYGDTSLKTHQVFIVESAQSYTFNDEANASDRILSNGVDNLENQSLSFQCNDKITNLFKSHERQHLYDISVVRNSKENTHNTAKLSNLGRHTNVNTASPDKVQNRKQILTGFTQLSNQALKALTETKESDSDEGNCSQRDQILDALQLTPVSLSSKKSKPCGSITNCYTLPITNSNKENKPGSVLKVLAEKLAEVFENNNSDNSSGEKHMSNLEKTILNVSRGFFEKNNQDSLELNVTSPSSKKRSTTKRVRRINTSIEKKTNVPPKFNLDVAVPKIQTGTNAVVAVPTVLEANCLVHQPLEHSIMNKLICPLKISQNTEGTKNPEINLRSIVESETNHNKDHKTPSPDLESINQTNVVIIHGANKNDLKHKQKHKNKLKSRKKCTDHTKPYKPLSPKNSGSYDNKLKFTFDKSVSVYSVSVVSTSKPQLQIEDINLYQSSTENSSDEDSQYCQIIEPHQDKNVDVVRPLNESSSSIKHNSSDLQINENDLLPDSADFQTLSSPFSDIPNLKSSFLNHYSVIFDDDTDALCFEMGYALLQNIDEAKKLQKLMELPQNGMSKVVETHQTHSCITGNDLKTAIQTCQDILIQSKRKFNDSFSQIHNKINHGCKKGTQLKIVLLTAWFMKTFLYITANSTSYLMETIHDVKTKSLNMLSDNIVKWPLLHKTFIKNEKQFECDCLLVLGFIKDSLNDQDEHIVESQTTAFISSNDQDNAVSVIINTSNETKTSNNIAICNVYSSQSELNKKNKSVVFQTKLNDGQSPKQSAKEPLQKQRFTSNEKSLSKEVFQSNLKRKEHEYNKKLQKHQKTNSLPFTPEELQRAKQFETHENVHPRTTPSSLVSVEARASNKTTGNNSKHFNKNNIPIQNQYNHKQISNLFLKEHVSNTEPINHNLPTKPFSHFPSNQQLNHLKSQPCIEAQSQVPTELKLSQVFKSSQSENQYHSKQFLKPQEQQNIQYFQSDQPNVHNRITTPLHCQYYNSNQADFQEMSINQGKTTIPTVRFQDNCFPTNSGTSYCNKSQFAVRNIEEISMYPVAYARPAYSVCDAMSNTGVTINNYSITNYPPHFSPEIMSNYDNPNISTAKRAL